MKTIVHLALFIIFLPQFILGQTHQSNSEFKYLSTEINNKSNATDTYFNTPERRSLSPGPSIIKMGLDSLKYPELFYSFKYDLNTFVISSSLERINVNFSNYDEFNYKYINLLNELNHVFMINFSGYYKNFFGLFGFGSNFLSKPQIINSLQTSTKLTKINFKIGYGFSSIYWNFIFTPYIALEKLNYHLLTNEENEQVSLSKYLQTQYYDINFIQWTGTIGSDLDVRLFSKIEPDIIKSIYLSVGAGYFIKLAKHPIIKSTGNKLSSSGYIEYENFYLQAGLKFYLYK